MLSCYLIFLIGFGCFIAVQGVTFSCQGSTYDLALANCTDKGAQKLSSGGNVYVNVRYATNLPDKNYYKLSTKVSNPYVEFIVGNNKKEKTKLAPGSLNPNWDEEINLGLLGSATEMVVSIYDENVGVEFKKDLLVQTTMRVPFCSQFNASYYSIDCGEPYGCQATDSTWEMPTRKMCVEDGAINFNSNVPCSSPQSTCLYVTFRIVPFVMEVELPSVTDALSTPSTFSRKPLLSVASSKAAPKANWVANNLFGYPFIGLPIQLDFGNSVTDARYLNGALMFRMEPSDRNRGSENDIYFYASVNFPAYVYVCRYEIDNAKGVPEWLTHGEFKPGNVSASRLKILGQDSYFACYYVESEGTRKNKWGGIESGLISFRTNTVGSAASSTNTYMYIVLAVPRVISPQEEVITIEYTNIALLINLVENGFVFAWFLYLICNFIMRIQYRIDRVMTYVVTRVYTGKDKTVLALLFLYDEGSPSNILFRSNLYHATNIIKFFLSLPFLLLIGWGFACAGGVKPRAIGYFIVFLGSSGLFLWYGFTLWEHQRWQMSPTTLLSLSLSIIMCLIFFISVIFADPAVTIYGHSLDFTALSLVFGTINCIPLLLLTFYRDKTFRIHLKLVVDKMSEAIYLLKNIPKTNKAKDNMTVNRAIHALLDYAYTINPNVPLFRYATVIRDVSKDSNQNAKSSHFLYNTSLLVLFVYLIIAVSRTDSPSLGFLHCLALMLLDTIHRSISSGDVNWSPGYHILLLVAGRLAITSSLPRTWLINYSVGFLVYSWSLVVEIVDSFLPMLTKRQAGEAVFTGRDINVPPNPDVFGSPHYCLGVLIYFYISLVLIAAFSASDALPLPPVLIWGAWWPMYSIGLISFVVVVVGGLGMATWRAFYLEKNGLLRGRARDCFLFRKEITLPIILSALLGIAIFSSGLLIYGATGSSAILTLCIFVPLISLCFGYAAKVWVENDYELVVWPPKDAQADSKSKNDTPSDLEVAFNMIENLFGEDNNGGGKNNDMLDGGDDNYGNNQDDDDDEDNNAASGQSTSLVKKKRTLKGFKLPTMQATAGKIEGPIKMPALPLKSVLRRKRELMGITASAPIVSDLAPREDGEDDKFGNDVLDLDDPWVQFEQAETAVTDGKDKQLVDDANQKSNTRLRKGYMESKFIVEIRRAFYTNPTLRWMKHRTASCWRNIRNPMTKYEKITPRVDPQTLKKPENADETAANGVSPESPDNNDLSKPQNKDKTGGPTDSMNPPPSNNSKELETKPVDDANDKPGDDGGTIATEVSKERAVVERKASEFIEFIDVDVYALPFWEAVFAGYLTRKETLALSSWFIGLFLVMLMGIVLNQTVSPGWMGPVVWVAIWTFVCTMVPIVKYFNVYKIDFEMKCLWGFVCLLHILFCFSFLGVGLTTKEYWSPSNFWIIDYLIYYPIFLYLCIEFYKWRDNNWVIQKLDADGDGDVTWREYLIFFKAYPIILALLIILNWQFYIWINVTFGVVFTLVIIVAIVGYSFVRDWASSNFFLSPRFVTIGNIMLYVILLISLLVALFQQDIPLFAISVFFVTLIFRSFMYLMSRILTADADTILYFAPYVMPVYAYDRRNNDIQDETSVAKQLFVLIIAGVVWGAWIAIFSYPVWVGIFVASVFLLAIASTVSAAVSVVPLQLGRLATLLSPTSIKDAANAAAQKFQERHSPLDLEISDWDGVEEPPDFQTEGRKNNFRSAIETATDIIEDIRSLRYVKDENYKANQVVAVTSSKNIELQELGNQSSSSEPVKKVTWYRRSWVSMKYYLNKLFAMMPFNKALGWKLHNEAVFNHADGLAEALITGRGPFGFVGIQGVWYRLFKWAQTNPRFSYFRQPWLNIYDPLGNRTDVVKLAQNLNCRGILQQLIFHDIEMDFSCHEEMRCAVHFITMMLVAGDAQLQREQITFQKFLRENRFRLASNGISPPADIFQSSSFASVDIALVACWLSRLTVEERERFHQLRASFSDEIQTRDRIIDDQDYQLTLDVRTLQQARLPRDKFMADKLKRDFAKSLTDRVKAFVSTLSQEERAKFNNFQEEWTMNADCTVDPSNQELYDKFKTVVMHHTDEVTEYARQVVAEVEAAQRDCRIGEFGRMYQFIDPDFSPNEQSIGDSSVKQSLQGWRCANGIRDGIQLFDGGTDPDDVEIGIFNNAWLLSAVSMLAAASGVGDGDIDQQVLNLFVGHYGIDGEVSYRTDVGCYGLRIFKQGMWIPIIIDDCFPMLKPDKWTNENRGMAGAHSKECREVWVSLIEKAYAKYYGSYAAIEKGYVHLALEDMTGAASECLPLSNASRGPGKKVLWDMLLRYKKYGFILGAGTGDAAQADKEIREMGIVFNAAYTIYDVREIDQHKLLKLRNPPGDHEEWKGDWSDHSDLWTTRLKKKLKWTDADDNTFWISFDDFCNVFRVLYVCKWHDPSKWFELKLAGSWKSTAGVKPPPTSTDPNAPPAPPQADTSGGLPTRHNPSCRLENNPHYLLKIYRPTDVKITLSQTDSRGVARSEPLPAAMYLCRNRHSSTPMRMKVLDRQTVLNYSGAPSRERTQHLYVTLRPGMYVVLVAAYTAGMEGVFTISIQSNYKVDFTQMWPARWLLNGRMVEGVPVEKERKLFDLGTIVKKNVQKAVQKIEGLEDGELDKLPPDEEQGRAKEMEPKGEAGREEKKN